MMTDDRNISTEHQPKGAARNPSDTLDKSRKPSSGKDAPPKRDADRNGKA